MRKILRRDLGSVACLDMGSIFSIADYFVPETRFLKQSVSRWIKVWVTGRTQLPDGLSEYYLFIYLQVEPISEKVCIIAVRD